jgi:toll-like receptor 13
MIISFAAFILVFTYRWHFRLLVYEAFKGKGEAKRRYLEEGHFNYDLFVCYASEQLRWVREQLMPELEGRLGLRLCVHDRDFIPGHNIVDNIDDCVESSKKIMMVFSRDFVRSHWCQFELAYCLSHTMEHDDVLIIVCLDDVVSQEMTSTMMAVLKTTTYIQWEQTADAMASFWGRIQLSLHKVFQANNARRRRLNDEIVHEEEQDL